MLATACRIAAFSLIFVGFTAFVFAQEGGDQRKDKKNIVRLIEALRNYHSPEGQEAFKTLVKTGEPAIPALLEAMNDRFSKDLRSLAASALVKMGKPGINALIGALEHKSWKVRDNAALHLGMARVGKAAVPMIRLLRDPHPEVRDTAAVMLGRIGESSAVDGLIAALADADYNVRCAAAEALGNLGDPKAVDPLVRLLKSDMPYVRRSAAYALGNLKDQKAVPALIAALEEDDENVTLSAAMALGEIGDRRAVEPLILMLRTGQRSAQREAAQALGMIADPRAVAALKEALRGADDPLRARILEALSRCGSMASIEEIKNALLSPDPTMRCLAVAALGTSGKGEALPLLVQALDDPIDRVRSAAMEALSRKGDPGVGLLVRALKEKVNTRWELGRALGKLGGPAVAPLAELLEDRDEVLRGYACEALATIGKPAFERVLGVLESKAEVAREGAARVLGRLKDERAVGALVERLDDPQERVRREAGNALRQIGGPAFMAVLPKLGSADPESRRRVAKILGACKDPVVVAALIAALVKEEKVSVRREMIDALGRMGNPAAIDPLLSELSGPKPRLADAAAQALARIGGPARSRVSRIAEEGSSGKSFYATLALARMRVPEMIGPLIEALANDDSDLRNTAAYELERWGEPVVGHLVKALHHPNVFVRCNAVYALGRIEAKSRIPALVSALRDNMECVRCAAAQALADLPADQVVEPVWEGLQDMSKGGNPFWAGVALANHGDRRGLEAILEGLDDFARGHEDLVDRFGNEIGLKGVEHYVAQGLAQIGRETVRPLLRMLNRDNEKLMGFVEECLVYIEDFVHPDLVQAMVDDDARFRERVVRVSGGIRPSPQRWEFFIRVLKDEDREVRLAAVQTLSRSWGRPSIGLLIVALGDDDPVVRSLAMEKLKDRTRLTFSTPAQWREWFEKHAEKEKR